jgi:hypothetical protein
MVSFRTKKSQFGKILETLRLENVYILYGHWEYFTDIWDVSRPFGTFLRFWYHVPRQIWQPFCELFFLPAAALNEK